MTLPTWTPRRRATPPPTMPAWMPSAGTVAALISVALTIIFTGFHLGNPDLAIQVTLLAVTGVLIPTVLALRHVISWKEWLSDFLGALTSLAQDLHITVNHSGPAGATPATSRPGGIHAVPGKPLGRKPARVDTRTLRAARYAAAPIVAPPTVNTPNIGWGMMLNNAEGDCTCAAGGHAIQTWTAKATGQPVTVPDSAVQVAYAAVSGYDPVTGANDNGANELDVLNYFRQVGIGGHKIDAYAAINLASWDEVRWAIATFGLAYIGVALAVEQQAQAGRWDYVPGSNPGSWGGHAVICPGYQTVDTVDVVTWGQVIQLTRAFWANQVEEAYALVSRDYLDAAGIDPEGLNLAQLDADLAACAT